jgi:hypothetical protein
VRRTLEPAREVGFGAWLIGALETLAAEWHDLGDADIRMRNAR